MLRFTRAGPPRTLTEATLVRLRRDILSGRLAPGIHVKGNELQKLYDVGASPVREALFQLVSEGLVNIEGQRGFRIASVSGDELDDITNWRVHLEGEAVRAAVAQGGTEWAERAQDAWQQLEKAERAAESGIDDEDADRWERSHREFHFALYVACGSPWLLRFCEMLIAQGERYRRKFVVYRHIDRQISDEHKALLDACLSRDADRATDILERHISHAAALARRHLPIKKAET